MLPRGPRFPIVGLGASAGGIPALEGFFKGVPDQSGMAFVVVTHLSPNRVSQLHEVVARYTSMPVMVAQDAIRVEQDRVYVMPENALLVIEDGLLRIRQPNVLDRERKPVDIFLAALAKDQGEFAVGIILSGGDGDGTLGVKVVKERGGFTLAQSPDESGPRFPSMPETAIASGLIDIALPADEMGARLVAFARGLDELANDDVDEAGQRQAREMICGILRRQTAHDFSGYKPKTFMRRVHRRMQVRQVEGLDTYIECLDSDPDEVSSLFRDLLINVTSFFRDVDAFELLAEMVIPRIFENSRAEDTVRVWVPGCATGEEVYSIAMLIREAMEALPAAPRIQIFATDIDELALSVARAGRYPEALLESVSQERRARYFHHDGDSYVVRKEVREMCIFSPHSVIRDPPFSRMDLVSCRNLLIYLGPEIQSRVIPVFHYSLKPGRFLFLGTSENISQYGHLFSTLDKKNRMFQRRDHAGGPVRFPLGGDHRMFSAVSGRPQERTGRGALALRQSVETQVLDHFAPAHVVVNSDGDVVYYSTRTGKYLEPPQGAPSQHLLTMARKGLRLDLRSALHEARETRRSAVRERIQVEEGDDQVQAVTVTVEPLADTNGGEPLFIVLFSDVGPLLSRKDADRRAFHDPDAARLDLERELRDTRERLQSTIEEYETALEELKSSNEELVSVNEEAQSTNEELEASKEEMQSLNEELNTINGELVGKIEELDRANGDLKNLFASTQIATIFLDASLAIRSFTPATSSYFSIIQSDIGRPLTDLAGRLEYPNLKNDILAVFERGETIETRIAQGPGPSHFLVRVLPYRDAGEKTRGVIATFVDVTSLAQAEEHQRVLISELNHRVKNMLAVVISIANRTRAQAVTTAAYHEALVGRIHSMAGAYELLAHESWNPLSVEVLIRRELAPFGFERIRLEGPDVHLDPRRSLSLAMVLHELATNAAKYGALSDGAGRTEITWLLDAGTFTFRWQDCDGPPALKPAALGFGLTLVQREIAYALGGFVDLSFQPSGLTVTLTFPMEDASRSVATE